MSVGPAAAVLFLLASASLPAQTAPAQWGLRSEVRIDGHQPGDGALSATFELVVSRGGFVFVPQPQEHLIRVYDSVGRFVRNVGRRGSGPGEFRLMNGQFVGWLGDTLWTIDHLLRRATYWSDAGAVHSTHRLPAPPVDDPRLIMTALLEGGRALFAGQTAALPSGLPARGPPPAPEAYLRVAGRDGRDHREVLRFRMASDVGWVEFPPRSRLQAVIRQPFSDAPLVAVSPVGDEIVIVERPRPASAVGTFSVRRIAPDGALISSRRHRFDAVTIADHVVDSVADEMARSLIAPPPYRHLDLRAVRTAVRGALATPRWFPAVDRAVVGADGAIWLRVMAQPGRWLILDRANEIVAQVMLPPSARVACATAGAVWVVDLDEFGVPTIVKHAIVR